MNKLTEHQQGVFNRLIYDIQLGLNGDKNNIILSLTGHAGTGKTFLLAHLIHHYSNLALKLRITAPTHQAVKVIKDTLENTLENSNMNDNFDFDNDIKTIHSFLRLKLVPNFFTGKHDLAMDKQAVKRITPIDILFVDEGSMVSSELLGYCGERYKNNTLKVIILIGDIFQLKPVDNEGKMNPFLNMDKYRLKETVRQVKDNPIIATSTLLKEYIEDDDYYPKINKSLFKNLEVIHNRTEFLTRAVEDKSYYKIGTYTNKFVHNYNTFLRGRLMNNPVNSTVVDDEYLFYSTLYTDNKINDTLIHLNSDVSTIAECELMFDDKHMIYYWQVLDTDGLEYKILDSKSYDDFNEILDNVKNEAKNEPNANKRNQQWGFYFSLQKIYANVRYNYASTLHRLQGTTLDNVYLDFSDLNNWRYDRNTVFRLMYVGITRAKNNAIILL